MFSLQWYWAQEHTALPVFLPSHLGHHEHVALPPRPRHDWVTTNTASDTFTTLPDKTNLSMATQRTE